MFLKGSRVPSWIQNRSKIDPRGYQKQDEFLNGFWMALGSILNGFWSQVGRQVEAKLEPKSTKMALQKEVENMIRKSSKKARARRPPDGKYEGGLRVIRRRGPLPNYPVHTCS